MKLLKILAAAALISAAIPLCVSAESGDRPLFDDSSVIVVTKPQSGLFRLQSASADTIMEELGITDVTKIASLPDNKASSGFSLFSLSGGDRDILKLTLPEAGEENVLNAVSALNSSGTVSYAQPNYRYYLDSTPNDPSYSSQYSLKKIGAPSVWDMNIDCSDTVVAIIDSGVQLEHEDLRDNLWTDVNGYHGYDCIDRDYIPDDNVGHGTHVAGIVSARTNNRLGVASLAGKAKIAAFKAFNDKEGSTATICIACGYMRSYEQAYGKTFSVINCSFGGPDDNAFKEMLALFDDKIIVAAAGNTDAASARNIDSAGNLTYPACYDLDNIISVANTTSGDILSSTSCYGKTNVDIASPGDRILSTYYSATSNSEYSEVSGTSMATPLVASTAAVLKSKLPELTPAKVKEYILDGADHISGLDNYISCGRRLNAYGALSLALSDITVDFDTDGGSAVAVQTVGYEGFAVEPSAPEKTGYDFTGWLLDGEPYDFDTPVTNNITLVASWKKKTYTITWKTDTSDPDTPGVLGTTTVEYGDIPVFPSPTKDDDNYYTYTFSGWSPKVTAATEDTEYTAVFTGTPRLYTIIWKNDDGTAIQTDRLTYGAIPAPPAVSKNDDDGYTYTFSGWSPEVAAVTGDKEYTAVFSAAEKITFTEIAVTDEFRDVLKLLKSVNGDGDIVIKTEAAAQDDDGPSSAPPLMPSIYAYVTVYEDGSLVSVTKTDLNAGIPVPALEGREYRVLIWTEDNEPVTDVITDVNEFFGI